MTNAIDRFWNNAMEEMVRPFSSMVQWSNRTNLIENEKEYILEVNAVGFNKEQANIKLNDNVLSISLHKEEKEGDGNKKYTRQSFVVCDYEKSFTLPDDADEEKIEAKMENGILAINIPKLVEEKKNKERKLLIK